MEEEEGRTGKLREVTTMPVKGEGRLLLNMGAGARSKKGEERGGEGSTCGSRVARICTGSRSRPSDRTRDSQVQPSQTSPPSLLCCAAQDIPVRATILPLTDTRAAQRIKVRCMAPVPGYPGFQLVTFLLHPSGHRSTLRALHRWFVTACRSMLCSRPPIPPSSLCARLSLRCR